MAYIDINDLINNSYIKNAEITVCELCNDKTLTDNQKAFIAGMIATGYKSIIQNNCLCPERELLKEKT